MEGDWDSVRTRLDEDYEDNSYVMGDWFSVPERSVVRLDTGRHFAQEKARTNRHGRRVVLAGVRGPNANLFARSSTIYGSFKHRSHPQPHGRKRCQMANSTGGCK